MNDDFRTYLFNYSHDGLSWGLEIKARDEKDALRRLSRLTFATYQGEVVAKVPIIAATPARIAVAVRNAGHCIREFLTR